jgi:hypothetical protein
VLVGQLGKRSNSDRLYYYAPDAAVWVVPVRYEHATPGTCGGPQGYETDTVTESLISLIVDAWTGHTVSAGVNSQAELTPIRTYRHVAGPITDARAATTAPTASPVQGAVRFRAAGGEAAGLMGDWPLWPGSWWRYRWQSHWPTPFGEGAVTGSGVFTESVDALVDLGSGRAAAHVASEPARVTQGDRPGSLAGWIVLDEEGFGHVGSELPAPTLPLTNLFWRRDTSPGQTLSPDGMPVDHWSVQAVDVAVTTPAGTFAGCTRWNYYGNAAPGWHRWVCPGVGLVRQTTCTNYATDVVELEAWAWDATESLGQD